MTVQCPRCGATSRDTEFCDQCNADLAPPETVAPPPRVPLPSGDQISLSATDLAALARPEACITIQAQAQLFRVRWVAERAWRRIGPDVARRQAAGCTALSTLQVVAEKGGHWIIAPASAKPLAPWRARPAGDASLELARLLAYLQKLAGTLDALRQAAAPWLTFEPLDLEHQPAGQGLWITNLDLGLPQLGASSASVSFNPRYCAPEISRFDAAAIGGATDVFHLALTAYYWLARLLPSGFQGKGLDAFRYKIPPLRIYAPEIPPGIAPVLERGMRLDPAERFAAPAEFCSALASAIGRAAQRARCQEPLVWDIGAHTRAGLAKTSAGRDNEDSVVVCRWPAPDRALVAVADGISICDVGSGALASRFTCLVLENAFAAEGSGLNFTADATAACARAAGSLLDWAKEHRQLSILQQGGELMGTTLTAAWLQANLLQVINLGDSRVYLVTADGCEQLTVDGDLGSSLLAAGVPPEHVDELGPASGRLRSCVGGCEINPEGKVQIAVGHNRPALSAWSMMPSDIVLLCTDGLIEEGLFLGSSDVRRLIEAAGDMPATDLAIQLADAAERLQRPVSTLEPEGFGDNISCIVIKITGGNW
jgi:serine/threonine protein phosphatase PrpC